ncbi:MAG: InlB B-repeat-containing protein [Christensenellaceae bacterium]|jgi:uncharacterized repeat protein (TIGR02543 family)|nr:InlB B-repeat-containing protein [Christensenellaceae bacterium]
MTKTQNVHYNTDTNDKKNRRIILISAIAVLIIIAILIPILLHSCASTVKLSFETNGGTTIETKELKKGSKIDGINEITTKEGYTFDTWFYDDALSNAVTFPFNINKDTKLYANWNLESFTISFDTDGGDAVASVIYSYGEHIDYPATSHQDPNSYFGGWIDLETGAEVTYFTMPAHNISLKAKWVDDPKYQTYTFDLNADNAVLVGVSSITGELSTAIDQNLIPIVTRLGYDFEGWFLDADCTIQFVQTTFISEGTIKLYAGWKEHLSKIMFNTNGGNTLTPLVAQAGTIIGLPIPTKINNKFRDWADINNLWKPELKTQGLMPDCDITLTAEWSTLQQISFNLVKEGASIQNPNDYINFEGVENAPFPTAFPIPDCLGYTFDKWYTAVTYNIDGSISYDDANIFSDTTFGATDIILYASWITNQYEVDVDGIQTQEDFRSVFVLPNISQDGFNLVGWGSSVADIVYFDAQSSTYQFVVPAQDLILTPVWLPWQEISFDANTTSIDTTLPMIVTTMPSPISGAVETLIGNLQNPSCMGYTFIGWTMDTEGTQFAPTTFGLENITLYAQWEANTYNVTFDPDRAGYNTVPLPITVKYGQPVGVLPDLNDGTVIGWHFNQWFDGKTSVHSVSASRLYEWTTDMTFYGSWSKIQCEIDFDFNGGDCVISSLTSTYGSTVALTTVASLLTAPTGYVFDYFLDLATGNQYYTTTPNPTAPLNGMNFKVIWKAKTYNITFNLGSYNWKLDGSTVSTIATLTIPFGETIGELPTPEVPTADQLPFGDFYFNFAGWTYSNGQAFNITTMPAENISLVASWTPWQQITLNVNTDDTSALLTDIHSLTGEVVVGASILEGADSWTIILPNAANVTRTGYGFLGWYLDKDCLIPMDATNYTALSGYNLYAKWGAKTYQITLYINGGDSIDGGITEIDSITFNTAIGALPDAQKAGNKFVGWFTSDGIAVSVTTTYTWSVDIELYAYFEENPIVELNLNVTDNSATIAQNYVTGETGTPIILPSNPTRMGYVFGGWYQNAACTDGNEYIPSNFVADETVYAKWTPNTHVIILNVNGGDALVQNTINVTFGTVIGTLEIPTRNGYTFDAWIYGGISEYSASTIYMLDEDITLFASWIKNPIIIFNVNAHGESITVSPTNLNGKAGTAIGALPTPTNRNYYTFIGWYADSMCSQAFTGTTFLADITLYAGWSANTYIIALNSNGGVAVSNVTAPYGASVTLPTTTMVGYSFLGWSTDGTSNNIVNYTTMPANGANLKAVWQQNATITFDLNTTDTNASATPAPISGAVGDALVLPTPTRTGYILTGWYQHLSNGNLQQFTATTFGSSDITLYADWQATIQTITFNANGGTVSKTTLSVIYGSPLYTLPTATNGSLYFVGWNTQADGNGIAYLSTTIYSLQADLTLYAIFTNQIATIQFGTNGGSNITSTTLPVGTTITRETLPIPTMNNMNFIGWFYNGQLVDDTHPLVLTASGAYLTAGWSGYQGFVFNTMCGDASFGSQSVTGPVGQTFVAPTPTRLGYTFAGWFYDTSFTQPLDTNTLGLYTVTVFAKWVSV